MKVKRQNGEAQYLLTGISALEGRGSHDPPSLLASLIRFCVIHCLLHSPIGPLWCSPQTPHPATFMSKHQKCIPESQLPEL